MDARTTVNILGGGLHLSEICVMKVQKWTIKLAIFFEHQVIIQGNKKSRERKVYKQLKTIVQNPHTQTGRRKLDIWGTNLSVECTNEEKNNNWRIKDWNSSSRVGYKKLSDCLSSSEK